MTAAEYREEWKLMRETGYDYDDMDDEFMERLLGDFENLEVSNALSKEGAKTFLLAAGSLNARLEAAERTIGELRASLEGVRADVALQKARVEYWKGWAQEGTGSGYEPGEIQDHGEA